MGCEIVPAHAKRSGPLRSTVMTPHWLGPGRESLPGINRKPRIFIPSWLGTCGEQD